MKFFKDLIKNPNTISFMSAINKYVDKFVIVESLYTHSGKKKEIII